MYLSYLLEWDCHVHALCKEQKRHKKKHFYKETLYMPHKKNVLNKFMTTYFSVAHSSSLLPGQSLVVPVASWAGYTRRRKLFH